MCICVSKDKIDGFRLTLLLLHDTYINNNAFVDNKVNEFIKKYNKFSKNSKEKINPNLIEYVKMSITYSLFETGIIQMYHLFEQFIKIYFNINLAEDCFKNAKEIAKKYDYNLMNNSYFELVNKYRLLNNAIKHGGIEELKKEHCYLINQTYDDNDYGTILDNKLNITIDEIDECCNCLYNFVEEMNTYFEDMGYIDN